MIAALLLLLQDIAVRGDLVHTMAGPAIENGVVIVRDGKIAAVGAAGDVPVPTGMTLRTAAVVVPGLIDARATVGLSGILNIDHDQDQLETSAPIQPELRAIDSYNPREELVAFLAGLGITTVHTGHAPGALISGQTLIAKTRGETIEEAVFVPAAMVAATLGEGGLQQGDKSPGTRAKAVAMLRQELIKAQEYRRKLALEDAEKHPDRDLRLETLVEVLEGRLPLLVNCQRQQDILGALRLRAEFGFRLVLDGAAESFALIDEIQAAGVPVIVHPSMMRPFGIWDTREGENASMETATLLARAGVPVALQSGYESYVPKTRVVLFEAAVAGRWGLSSEQTLALITIEAARILGIDDRVGSLQVGKDGDLALYDGDPLETATHCVGVIIEGELVSDAVR